MNREKDLAKNTIIISFGQFLPKLTTLITLPILTSCLTKVEYGTYDLINTLVSLIIPIVVLKLDMGVFRFLIEYRNDEQRKAEIISTTYCFVLLTSTLSVIAMFFLLRNIEPLTKLLICIYFLLDIVYITTQQIIRGLSKNLIYAMSSILYAVVNMAFIVLLVSFKGEGLKGLLCSMILGASASSIFLIIFGNFFRNIKFAFSCSLLKEMLSYSWPLIPNSLSGWVMNLSDRLVITAMLGIEMNAIYAVANKIPNLLNILQSSFSAAWQENASLTVKNDDTAIYYSSMFDTLFRILVGATGLLIGGTPILFCVLINENYKAAYYQMPFLFGAMFFSVLSSFLGGIYAAHKRTKSVGITTVLAAICNLIVNIALINTIGLYAASFSTFVSYFILVIYRMIDIRKFQKMSYNYTLILTGMGFLAAMSVISYVNVLFLDILNLIISVVLAFFINKNLIFTILKKLV